MVSAAERTHSTAIPLPFEDKTDSTVPSADFGIFPIPTWLRHDPNKPFHFGPLSAAFFGFTSAFVTANLYYCQPLLIQFSKYFDIAYGGTTAIPTLMQAGYTTGLLLISPLGDLVRRRQLILSLILASTTLTVGLCLTPSPHVFDVLCYFIGVSSVTPHILIPLAVDLVTPERRASAVSVVISGLMLGVLTARVLAGAIGNFNTWHMVYYMSIGIQCLVFVSAYFLLPDYPAKNCGLTYFDILRTMVKYTFTEPLLAQATLINIASSACFSGFWVTLTFLLGGPPYHYSTLDIGLFGLVGILGVLLSPFIRRLIDGLVPWYATLVATFALLLVQSVQTAAGGISVAAVIIVCFGLDLSRQLQQVSLSTAVLSISTAAGARLNAIFMLSGFMGQVMGTSVSRMFVKHGWRACSFLMLALYTFQLGILVLRGPHCPRDRWFGWSGGFGARKAMVDARSKDDASGAVTLSSTDELRPPEKCEAAPV